MLKRISSKYKDCHMGVNFELDFNEQQMSLCVITIYVDLLRIPTILDPEGIFNKPHTSILNNVFDHTVKVYKKNDCMIIEATVMASDVNRLHNQAIAACERLIKLCNYKSLCVGSNKFYPTIEGFYLNEYFFSSKWVKDNPVLYGLFFNNVGRRK